MTFDLDLDLENTQDARLPEDHRVKFGSDPANCLREEAICAKVYRQTDRRRAIALAHSWNELTTAELENAISNPVAFEGGA